MYTHDWFCYLIGDESELLLIFSDLFKNLEESECQMVELIITVKSCLSLGQFHQHFYEQLLRQNPFIKNLQTQTVSTLKLRKKLLYEKAARKILVKFAPALCNKSDIRLALCEKC
jgi:hypothetical protein